MEDLHGEEEGHSEAEEGGTGEHSARYRSDDGDSLLSIKPSMLLHGYIVLPWPARPARGRQGLSFLVWSVFIHHTYSSYCHFSRVVPRGSPSLFRTFFVTWRPLVTRK
jgi:hypothetical protein